MRYYEKIIINHFPNLLEMCTFLYYTVRQTLSIFHPFDFFRQGISPQCIKIIPIKEKDISKTKDV